MKFEVGTWCECENTLYGRVHELRKRIHTDAYRAQPSRRVCIPETDGSLRALDIAAVEDKIVRETVVKVLSAVPPRIGVGQGPSFRAPERGIQPGLPRK